MFKQVQLLSATLWIYKQITKHLFLAIYNVEHYSERFRIWKSINCLQSM